MIYTPQNVPELLSIYKRNPDASLFAGGTWLLGHQTGKFLKLNKKLISLSGIDELKKITRSERFLEFGACATLADILKLKARIMPPILHEAIRIIATPQVRNLGTIGGNLAVPDQRMSLYPALIVLDARLELRRQGSSRWVDIRRFINDENEPDIQPGEIISRIRIPIEEWEFQRYKTIGDRMQIDRNYIVGSTVAKLNKQMLLEARILMIDGHRTQLRPFQTEGNLIGKKLPLDEKDRQELLDIFSRELNSHPIEADENQKQRLTRIFHWMLAELSDS